MLAVINNNGIKRYLKTLRLKGKFRRARLLAFLSAAIALEQYKTTRAALEYLKSVGINRRAVYETVIQSYLFLGFPRMIEAAFVFHEIYGPSAGKNKMTGTGYFPVRKWVLDGRKLCREVYGKNYERLRTRIIEVGPEIFEWMVLEGYGKVLSRPGLTKIEREVAEVAALIIERRERQLISHILGSLNVGADIILIRQVNKDIAFLAGHRKFRQADKIITRLERRYETQN